MAAYHSSKNPGVYHLYDDCYHGNNIERKHRKSGTGGGALCTVCAARQKATRSKRR